MPVNQSTPIDVIAKEFGGSIADMMPTNKGFALLVFQGGDQAGMAFSTNTDEELALNAMEAFVTQCRAIIDQKKADAAKSSG